MGGGLGAAGDRADGTLGHGMAGGHRVGGQGGPVIRAIKEKTKEYGRYIDDDHFGAGFGFRFGSADEPIMRRYIAGFTRSLGKPPDAFTAVGGREEIMALVDGFRKAGAHKFVLRPIASGTDDMLAQTHRLIDEVLPEFARLN